VFERTLRRDSAIRDIARLVVIALIGPLTVVSLGLWASPAAAQPYTPGGGPLQTSTGSAPVATGSSVSVAGSGFAPGASVSIFIASTPTLVGTATTNSSGRFVASIVIPPGLESGTHTLTATGPAADGGTVSLTAKIVVNGEVTSASSGFVQAASEGSAPSGLPFTGADIAQGGTVGIALILLGGLIFLTIRRLEA
jgi:hypothetical protein